MPSKPKGPCVVIAADPGCTTGVVVASVDPRWLKGQGAASWEGMGKAVLSRVAYQIGREPKSFDIDTGRTTKLDEAREVDALLLPVLADHQPLLTDVSGEFDGRGRADEAFYRLLDGEDSASAGVPRADLLVTDAEEVLQIRQLAGLADNYPGAALVCEDYTVRGGLVSTDRETFSPDRLRLAWQTEEALHGEGRVLFLQQASSAKTTCRDDRLRRAGLYFRGMRHATDAGRHVALFLRRCRADEALRAQAFPRHFTDWTDDEGV